jgi:dipeptidyl-peptidase-4
MTILRAPLFLFLLGCAIGQAPPAVQRDASRLDAVRITSGEFASERFGPVRWLDGSHFATLEGLELVRHDAASGAREVLVPATRLRVAGREQPLRIEDYAFSPDLTRLLLFTDSERVWRENTRGEYWVLELKGNAPPRRLGGELPKSSLMYCKFSPKGDRVGYVSGNDLYVEDPSECAPKPVINGNFDWVYEEEFHLHDGWRWSPDGTRIAYWQLDCEGVGDFLMIDNLSDVYSKTVPVQFPKAGTTNSSCRIGVIPAGGGETVWMKTPGDPRNTYLARMDWHPNGAELMVQWLPRQQNRLDVLACEVSGGAVRTIWTERADAYLEVRDDFRWLRGGESFFWTSDQDGWRHAYSVPWGKGEAVLLTPGNYDVMAVELADVDKGMLLVSGCDGRPTDKYLFALREHKAVRLSPREQQGWHDYQVSTDGSLAIHMYSSFDMPPRVDLVKLPSHETVRMLVTNDRLRERYAAVAKGKNEFFRVKTADGVEMDGWAMYPPGFDPEKKWPVLFHVYGEPWSQTVKDTWFLGHHLFHRWMTQLGYVVMSVDARGTPAPRGREWRTALYQKIGVLSSHDWDQACRELCAQHAWMDRSRLAIWGWSGGGSMTLNMLFRYPDLFAAGMSVAPVTDIGLYDTIYQERYSGIPQEVPDVYRECSPIFFAQNLKAHLLLVHGTGDDNVHYQHSERLVNELIKHGKMFEFMPYPNRTHAIAEGKGTRTHVYAELADFLNRRVAAGPR